MDTHTVGWRKTKLGNVISVSVKDTSGMFLLHGRLGRVDGLADAAQLCGEQKTGVNQGWGGAAWPASPPTSNTHDNGKYTSGGIVEISSESMKR